MDFYQDARAAKCFPSLETAGCRCEPLVNDAVPRYVPDLYKWREGPLVHDDWLGEGRAEAIARKVREEIARRRISRQALADTARISLSTLEKALSGRRAFTLATVIRLEEALGTSLRGSAPPTPAPPGPAPDELGGYAHGAVRWLEGRYLTIRPLFGGESGFHAYVIEIVWDPTRSHLIFAESGRMDGFAQAGSVSLPHLSGHIYLLTSVGGQYRLIILGRPTIKGALYGTLTTLVVGHGSQLVPAACPIALLRLKDGEEPAVGRIDPDHEAFDIYRTELATVTARDFARFPGAAEAS